MSRSIYEYYESELFFIRHLAREFADLAGESPTAWARRQALTNGRLTRPDDALAWW